MQIRVGSACLGVWLTLSAPLALSAPCGELPYVHLSIEGGQDMANGDREAIRLHLQAELGQQDVAVCYDVSAALSPLAHVRVKLPDTTPNLEIHIEDSATSKRVVRTMELLSVPRDARPLAVGIAAGELLRASWFDWALASRARSQAADKAQIVAQSHEAAPPAVPAPAPTSQGKPWAMSGGVSMDVFGGGLTFWGPDLDLSLKLSDVWRMSLRGTYRSAWEEPAPDGSGTAWAVGGTWVAARRLVRHPAAWSLEAIGAIAAARVEAAGRAQSGATAYSGSGLLGTSSLGLRGAWSAPASLHPAIEVMAGTCWACLALEDGPVQFASASGWMISASLRLEIAP